MILKITSRPFLIFLMLFVLPYSLQAQSSKKYSKEVLLKMKAVESNLSGWVQIENNPQKWTLEERMQFYKANGVSIAVIRDYQIEWAKGYGWADSLEQRPVTTKTLFQAGSNSKSLHAIGMLRLMEEGKLDLNADINDYLKTWKFPYDSLSRSQKITVANLLSHTAGLTVHGFDGYEIGDTVPTLLQILDGQHPANSPAIRSKYAPSLQYEYSGGGTTISQLIMEDITGIPYDAYMLKYVLKPLGMSGSSYTQPPAVKHGVLATGYYNDGKAVPGKYHIYPEQAAAGLWTNPTDLAKYVIDTQLSLLGKSEKVLSKETTALRLTPYIDKSAALGVFVLEKDGVKHFQHGGVDEGFVSQYVGTFEGGNGVVVMTNTYNTALFDEIITSVAAVYGWNNYYSPVLKKEIVPEETDLQAYPGKYVIGPFHYALVQKSDGLYLDVSQVEYWNNTSWKIHFTNPMEFFVTETDAHFKFTTDTSGNITGFNWNEDFLKKE